jgi:hypothetical protein
MWASADGAYGGGSMVGRLLERMTVNTLNDMEN